jgi:hypothetical protein
MMKKTIQLVFSLGLASLLLGCRSPRQFVELPDQTKTIQNPGYARIYVLRPGFTGTAVLWDVWEPEGPRGRLAHKSYLCWERPPGNTTISCQFNYNPFPGRLELKVEKNSVYYLVVRWGALELVDEATGQRALRKCSRSPHVESR